MVPNARARDGDGHHQCRDRGGGRDRASSDCTHSWLHELALDLSRPRWSRFALDCLVEVVVSSSDNPRKRDGAIGGRLFEALPVGQAVSYPRDLGTGDRQISERCGLVLLPFLASEISL